MNRIFFVSSALPPLQLGIHPPMSFSDLIELFDMNLKKRIMKQIHFIRLYIDLHNVKQILKKEILDFRGNLNEKELDEALTAQEDLPTYLYDHLNQYTDLSSQLRYFSRVFIAFFNDMKQNQKGFLSFYFDFERKLRLILTGLRAKKLGLDLTNELQYEDLNDPFIAFILAQKDHSRFEFPSEYFDLSQRLQKAGNDPLKQYKALAEYRLSCIEDKIQDRPFSPDWALGYLVKFMIVQDWDHLNEKRGQELLKELDEI